jgi:hypothetical protein
MMMESSYKNNQWSGVFPQAFRCLACALGIKKALKTPGGKHMALGIKKALIPVLRGKGGFLTAPHAVGEPGCHVE